MASSVDSQKQDGLSIRNRARLPAGRSLTISVTWLRMPGVMLLTLALAGLSFLAGVAAGTGGWYRETVVGLTGALDSASPVRRILLAPDRTAGDMPSMRDGLAEMKARLDAMAQRQDAAFANYEALGSAYGSFNGHMEALIGATQTLGQRTESARSASQMTRQQLDALILAVQSAQRARAAVDHGTPSQQPNPREPDNVSE